MTARLIVRKSEGVQEAHRLFPGCPVTIGRSEDCELRLPDSSVSRRHCRAENRGDGWVIVDLGSGNGTLVNGQRVQEHQLASGDRIKVGREELEFSLAVDREDETIILDHGLLPEPTESPLPGTCAECGVDMVDSVDPSTKTSVRLCPKCKRSLVKPGTRVGRYTVRQLVGEGAISAVYRADDATAARPVALKVLKGQHWESEKAIVRFLREAETLASLDHPHIVHLYDTGSEGDLSYLAMEWVDGPTLSQVLEKKGALATRDALIVATHIAEALAYMHGKDIVHRDIKPSNVMLTMSGVAKVADFGLAKSMLTSGYSGVTGSGALLGSPRYMAPEQMYDMKHGDWRTDAYSLGATLYCVAAGAPPFAAMKPIDLAQAILETGPEFPVEHVDPAQAALWTIIAKAMDRDPLARHQSPSELLSELESALALASG